MAAPVRQPIREPRLFCRMGIQEGLWPVQPLLEEGGSPKEGASGSSNLATSLTCSACSIACTSTSPTPPAAAGLQKTRRLGNNALQISEHTRIISYLLYWDKRSSTFLAASYGFRAHGDLQDSAAIRHSVLLQSSCAREAATKLCSFAVAWCEGWCEVAVLLVRRISVV